MLRKTPTRPRSRRTGAIAVAAAILIPVFIAMLAFAIDCGYLLQKRSGLQRAADAAALAAVRDLVPDAYGNQNLNQVRATIRQFADSNVSDISGFTVLDADVEIGRYDPGSIYNNVTLLDSGIFDTVRVKLRRDSAANAPVMLFFTGIFGIDNSDVSATATAVLQKASILEPGAGVLPFSIPEAEWNATSPGDTWTVYGDGRMIDGSGGQIPGNWGTLNLGTSANSTATLNDQVLNGFQQIHLDGLYSEGRIPHDTHIDSRHAFNANGDQGLSGGMKQSIQQIHGQTRLIPIYDTVTAHGSNLEFHVTGWAVCEVVDSTFHGAKNTYVEIRKSYTYDGVLKPQRDLSITTGVIEGAFTIPALVE
jgi:hypothetical protein